MAKPKKPQEVHRAIVKVPPRKWATQRGNLSTSERMNINSIPRALHRAGIPSGLVMDMPLFGGVARAAAPPLGKSILGQREITEWPPKQGPAFALPVPKRKRPGAAGGGF